MEITAFSLSDHAPYFLEKKTAKPTRPAARRVCCLISPANNIFHCHPEIFFRIVRPIF
ncbi:MAG TPA: hypothetical protein H9700_14305 [Candidatus Eisenbergiella intestinipullorum]|nr:hypothetical protein [Candidatus Eisenbergiella intestinipullorum]